MKPQILAIFFIIIPFFSSGSLDCRWTSSKKGVTISFLAPCEDKYLSFVDSFLNQLLIKLNSYDTTLHILVMANDARLSFPNSNSSNFISIAFDTLRLIDDGFISDYYFGKEKASMQEHHGENQSRSRYEPLDINSSNIDTSILTGIKIIFRTDYYFDQQDWEDLEKLILFSAKNAEFIKKNQSRYKVQYDYNGWFVSLLSIDTSRIGSILRNEEIEKKAEAKEKSLDFSYPLIGLLLVGITIFFIAWHRQTIR